MYSNHDIRTTYNTAYIYRYWRDVNCFMRYVNYSNLINKSIFILTHIHVRQIMHGMWVKLCMHRKL
jgi:hypothetical protein